MNHYQTLQRAHTTDRHNRYYRYELGQLVGKYRNMPALIVDEQGLDGLGLDIDVGGIDDRWCVLNLFDELHRYIDSVAINGAMDKDHATSLALSQFDHLNPAYVTLVANDAGVQDSFDAMQWHSTEISRVLSLDSQNVHYLPIINKRQLSEEQYRLTADRVMWDSANMPVSHGGSISRLFLDIQKHDAYHELTDKFELSEALLDINAQELGFDAVADTYNRLDIFKERLFNAMAKAPKDGLSVTGVTMTKPFKRQGVANVAMVFELSDGQTISIWFHNPDATPAKIGATDIMVSWKWLLNKRDVTGVLNPANSDSVQHADLARRMMLLASKNSKRFAAAQRRKNENLAKLERAEQEVQAKMNRVDELDFQIKKAKERLEAMGQKVTATPAQEKVNDMSVIKEVLVDVDNEVIGATDTPEERLNAKPTQEIIHNPQDKPRVEMIDDESVVSGVIDEFVLKGGVVGETGEDDKRIHNHAFATLEQAQTFIQKLYGNADDVPSQDEPYDEVFLAITYTDKDGKQHKKERWTSLIIKDHDTMFNPFSQTIADYLWDDLVALGIDPTQVQGKLAVSDTSVGMEELTAQQIKDEYKSRFENKDHEWLGKYQKQISVIFENRINAVKAELRKYGFTDDGAYRMEKGRTLLHIDGGDLDWIFVSYNFDGDMKGSVHDMLDKKAEEVAKDILAIYHNQSSNEPTDEPIVLTGKEFGEFDLSNNDDVKKFAQKVYQELDNLNGEFVFNKSLNANVKLNTTGLNKIRRYNGLDKSPVKLQAVAKLKEIVANAKLFKTDDSYDVGGQKGGLVYYYLKTPFIVDGVEYGARIVIRGDGNGNFYYDFQVKDDVSMILDGAFDTTKNPLGRDISYDWKATSNGFDGYSTNLDNESQDEFDDEQDEFILDDNQASLFDGLDEFGFDAARKPQMVLNLFIFDKDGNEIGDEIGNEADNKTPAETAQDQAKDVVMKVKNATLNNIIKQSVRIIVSDKDNWWSNGHIAIFENPNGIDFGTTDKITRLDDSFDKYINPTNKTNFQIKRIAKYGKESLVELTGNGVDDFNRPLPRHLFVSQRYLAFLYKYLGKTIELTASDVPNTPILVHKGGKLAGLIMPMMMPEIARIETTYAVNGDVDDDENKPNDEQDMNNPNYTQSDIDYLQSIINGTLDLETVDMDKMIEIGEKDESDPMYEQALQIISDYLDEMSQ